VTIKLAGSGADVMLLYRPELCFWNSVVLYFTLLLTAAQVFATALNTYFQLTIMLMILMIGITALAHFRPFPDPLLQRMQVNLNLRYHCSSVCLAFLCKNCNDSHMDHANMYLNAQRQKLP